MCYSYFSEYKLPVKIARLSQTIGAGVDYNDNRVFVQFARNVIEHKNIILHTDGKSEGNYCYIRDAVEGIFTVLLLGVSGEAYNVSKLENGIKKYTISTIIVKTVIILLLVS